MDELPYKCSHCDREVSKLGIVTDKVTGESGCTNCMTQCKKCHRWNYSENMTGVDMCWDCYHFYDGGGD